MPPTPSGGRPRILLAPDPVTEALLLHASLLALTTMVVAQQATDIGPWVTYPTLVMLVATLAAAPVWPWSRRWGWTIAGIFAVSAATAALFTGAWLLS